MTTVLHVVNTLEGGGMERVLVALLQRFQEPSLRHVVVTLREPGSLASRLPDHVPCFSLHSRRRSLSPLARLIRSHAPAIIHARGIGCWFDAISATALARFGLEARGYPETPSRGWHGLTRRGRPWFLQHSTASLRETVPPTAGFRIGSGVSLLLGFHGWEQRKPLTAKHRLIARMGRALSARFISVSYSGADLLHRELAIPRDQIDVLPNGVDLGRFAGCRDEQRSETRVGLQIGPDAFVVTLVGSLTAVKCHSLLIAAAQQLSPALPDLRVLFVGVGPLRDQLEHLTIRYSVGACPRRCAAQKGQRYSCPSSGLEGESSKGGLDSIIRFLGRREDIPAILAASDLYVCASTAEGMSNAVLEALAAGLPVIATAVGDNPRLIRDRTDGVLVQPGSSTALAEAIRALAADRPLRQRLGTAARLRAAQFSLDSCVRSYQELYGRLTANQLEEDNSDAAARQNIAGLAACDIKTNAPNHVLHQAGMHTL